MPQKSLSIKLFSKTFLPKQKINFRPLGKFISGLKLGKNSRAGVLLNKKRIPQAFIFDTWAMLDILYQIRLMSSMLSLRAEQQRSEAISKHRLLRRSLLIE